MVAVVAVHSGSSDDENTLALSMLRLEWLRGDGGAARVEADAPGPARWKTIKTSSPGLSAVIEQLTVAPTAIGPLLQVKLVLEYDMPWPNANSGWPL